MRLHMPVNKQFMYKRLKKIRRRAILVGMIYFIGILLLAVLALLPMLKVDYLAVIPGLGNDKMIWDNMELSWDIDTISRLLYLIGLIVGVGLIPFLAARRLNWLFTKRSVKRKKSASTHYDIETEQNNYRGFNRNVYAMKDLANWFSWSFAVLLINNVMICALNGSYGGEKLFDFSKIMSDAVMSIGDLGLGIDIAIPIIAIVVALAFIITMICRLLAVKIRLFTAESGSTSIGESRFSIFLRTVFQYILIMVVPAFMLQINTLNDFTKQILAGNFSLGFSVYISAGVELLVWFAWLALTYCPIIYCHRCMVTEYNMPERGTDYYFMLGVSIVGILLSAGLYVVKDKLAFNFESVESMNALMLVAILLVVTLLTRFLTKATARYSEYDQVISMVTSNDEFENVDWRYFFSDNYVGGEETGDIIE